MRQWLQTHKIMLVNTCSLLGATALTSGLGFVYWWIAARWFSPNTIGVASACISTMSLLGDISIIGFNTLLITEIPRNPGDAGSLLSTALLTVGIVGTTIGFLFALNAASLFPAFQPLRGSLLTILLFSCGVGGYAMTLVLDQALIGLLKGGLQFWRNTFFATIKLVMLLTIPYWSSQQISIKLYSTWVISMLLSLCLIAIYALRKMHRDKRNYLPQWGLLRKVSFSSLKHHGLNITLQAPTLLLPVFVTLLLSAQVNAWFYMSWMIVSFIFIVSGALTMVLHAMNSAEQVTLGHRLRLTISLSLLVAVLANLVLQFGSGELLSVFGKTYATEAVACVRILALAAFPLIIKNHYTALCRIQDRITQATIAMIPGGLLELTCAAFGAWRWGLSGLSLGWVCALTVEAVMMFPIVYRTLRPISRIPEQIVQTLRPHWEIWERNTGPLWTSGNGVTNVVWLNESLLLTSKTKSLSEIRSGGIDQSKHLRINRGAHLRPLRLQSYMPSSTTTSFAGSANPPSTAHYQEVVSVIHPQLQNMGLAGPSSINADRKLIE